MLQSVAFEAFREIAKGGFEHRGEGSLRAWLHRLVVHKICDRAAYFGAEKRRGGEMVDPARFDELPAGDLKYRDGDRYLALEKALQQLPNEMRSACSHRTP